MICQHCGEDPESQFTKRQLEAWESFVAGHSYSEIAAKMGITKNTVEAHLWNVKQILGIHGSAGQCAVVLVKKWAEHQRHAAAKN